MTTQLFKVVGITVHGGNAKVRFTDDMVRRVKQFTKGGATRTDFIELPNEMTKIESLHFMLSHPEFQSADDQATITDALEDRAKEAKRGSTVTVKAPEMTLENIRSRSKKSDSVVANDVASSTEATDLLPAQ